MRRRLPRLGAASVVGLALAGFVGIVGWCPGGARAEPVDDLGLADLHLHQWAEYNYGGEFYQGHADGPADVALAACGRPGADGSSGQLPPLAKHGQTGGVGFNNTSQMVTHASLDGNANDDTRRHPPGGVSTREEFPSFLGWPTSDSVAHQQAWTGWLRLAHDGLPFRWYLQHLPADEPALVDDELTPGESWRHLRAFYEDYGEHMREARANGASGLNLAVVSLVASNTGCRGIVSDKRKLQEPDVCDEPTLLRQQYQAAISWGLRNSDWAAIVTTPEHAREVIAEGRLAVVLSLESSDVLRNYVPRIRALAARPGWFPGCLPDHPETWTDALVREALKQELDTMPLVSTLSPVHQLDNPFGGGAVVSLSINRLNAQRVAVGHRGEDLLREPRLVSECPEGESGAACAAARASNANHYASAWFDATNDNQAAPTAVFPMVLGELQSRHALQRFASTAWPAAKPGGAMRARPANAPALSDAAAASPDVQPVILHNQYGLSHHGELLLDLMTERGMPVDLSHASDQMLVDVRAYVRHEEAAGRRAPTVYLSHAYPRAIDATPNELHVLDENLRWVGERRGVIGVRPGDDHVRGDVASSKAPGGFVGGPVRQVFPVLAQLLAQRTCQGTSVGSITFAAWIHMHAPGAGMAFGTDLNGFINQPGAAGQPRQPNNLLPCGPEVPSVGSEVGTRGLAHIGLLPAFLEEMEATADRGSLRWATGEEKAQVDGALTAIESGARSFIEMWERAGPSSAAAVEAIGAPPRPPLARPGHPVLEVSLPLLRAIEGTLPYVATAERGSPVLVLPQLPTNVALLLGWKTWGMQRPERVWRPEAARCVEAWGERTCASLLEAAASARKGWAKGDNKDRSWGIGWHREFLGDVSEFSAYLTHLGTESGAKPNAAALSRSLSRVYDDTVAWIGGTAGGPTSAAPVSGGAPVSSANAGGAVETHLTCLQDYTFTEAPPPTLYTGNDSYVRCRLGDPIYTGWCDNPVATDWALSPDPSAPMLKDGAGHGVSCYCSLLDHLERAGDPLNARDRYVLALCRQPQGKREKNAGFPVGVEPPPLLDLGPEVPAGWGAPPPDALPPAPPLEPAAPPAAP